MTTAELLNRIDETVRTYETYAEVPANVPQAMRATAREACQTAHKARNAGTSYPTTQTQERTAQNA